MCKYLRQIEYDNINVKSLGFFGIIGLLLAVFATELLGHLMVMPLEMVLERNSMITVILAELLTKTLVLCMLWKFYQEKDQPLRLSDLVEDAFVPEDEQVKPIKSLVTRRRLFLGTIIVGVIGFRFFYDNSLSYVLTSHIEVNEALLEAVEELFVWPIYAIFSIVVIAPFYEEILFRKFMLGGLLKRMNPIAAIGLSAFFFGLIHLNWLQGINAFILGFIAGWIYYKTESIGLAIFCHFINNFYALSIGIVQEIFLAEPILWANVLMCTIGGLLFLFAKRRFTILLEENTEYVNL